MRRVTNRRFVCFILGALVLFLLVGGCAQPAAPKEQPAAPKEEKKPEPVKFPERTITIVVPWPAGGRSDTTFRIVAPVLEKVLNVPVVVANHPGGAGVVGATAVARAKPDGYTLGNFSISHLLAQYTKDPPFKLEEFVPIAQLFSFPIAITVRSNAPWKTLEEFMNYAKANPKKVKQGTSGKGGSDHVLSAGFFKKFGVEVQDIPYAGDAPAVSALVTGEVDFVATPLVSVKSHVDAGTLKVLGISHPTRHPLAPDIPSFKEAGFDYSTATLEGVFAPKNTPPEIVKILESAFKQVTEDKGLIEQLGKLYVDVNFLPSEEFNKKIQELNPVLSKLTEELGVKISK